MIEKAEKQETIEMARNPEARTPANRLYMEIRKDLENLKGD